MSNIIYFDIQSPVIISVLVLYYLAQGFCVSVHGSLIEYNLTILLLFAILALGLLLTNLIVLNLHFFFPGWFAALTEAFN